MLVKPASRTLRTALTVASCIFVSLATLADETATARENRNSSTQQIADGLYYYYRDQDYSPPDQPREDEIAISLGVVRDAGERGHVTACGAALKLEVRFEEFYWAGDKVARYYEALAGRFASQDALEAFLQSTPVPTGCIAWPTRQALFARPGTPPSSVHVFELYPRDFRGRLQVANGNEMTTGRVKTSQIARHHNALAAINGGFFVGSENDGVVGQPTSVSIVGGRLRSEPISARPWIAITNENRVSVRLYRQTEAVTPILMWSDGSSMLIDGVNRKPELKRDCGSVATRSKLPVWHDHTCLMQDQLVVINADAGFQPTRFPNATYAIIGLNGKVTKGFAAPGNGEILLMATGAQVERVKAHFDKGHSASIIVPWLKDNPGAFAIAGAPTLLAGGKKIRAEITEGWPFAQATWEQANRMHRWINIKNPRTAIGIREDGTIVLAVVDGQRFSTLKRDWGNRDGGATIEEMRDLMIELGAVDAMNLDGGGSSTAVINGEIVSTPSDDAGERAVGDVLIIVPE